MNQQFVKLKYKDLNSSFVINKNKIIMIGNISGKNGYGDHSIIWIDGYKSKFDGSNRIEIDYRLDDLLNLLNKEENFRED